MLHKNFQNKCPICFWREHTERRNLPRSQGYSEAITANHAKDSTQETYGTDRTDDGAHGGPSRTGHERVTKVRPYKSWCYQLAAYRRALGEPVKCMNLIVNSNEPTAPIEHVWSEEEVERGWAAFEAARRLWVIEKGYEPAEGGGRSVELPEAA